MHFARTPVKLTDCKEHGVDSDAELYIVEGDSAAISVASVCDLRFQAVLPMQGKPLNAMKAKLDAIEGYELFRAVYDALGYEPGSITIDPSACRFTRVIFLFDPDADGIHCGALMLMFFYRMMRPLLDAGRICLVRAPLYEITFEKLGQAEHATQFAYSDDHARALVRELKSVGYSAKRRHYRGLAGIPTQTLLATCISPETRVLNRLRSEDGEAAIAVFGGQPTN